MTKAELEIWKLEREIKLVELNLANQQRIDWRGWLTAVSITLGILVSTFSVYQTLLEVRVKDKQLTIESELRTKELYLTLLQRITGGRGITQHFDQSGTLVAVDKQIHRRDNQLASYDFAIALGKDFPSLQPMITAILLRQYCYSRDNDKLPKEEEEEVRQKLVMLKWKSSDSRHDPGDPDTFCRTE